MRKTPSYNRINTVCEAPDKTGTGPEVIKLFSWSTQLSMKFFLLINVKMPTIVGILTFMSGKNSILGLSEPKKAKFLDICILMSIQNFMLNSVEHEKSFITSGPGLLNDISISPNRTFRERFVDIFQKL